MRVIQLKTKRQKTDEDWEKIKEISQKLMEKRGEGVLVVSSATSNPRSNRVKLFRELLGFEVGTPTFYLRNVVDAYQEGTHNFLDWVKRLGGGGLLFVSSDKGKEEVDRVVNILRGEGISAVSYEELKEETLKDFEEGKIQLLVGIASYRNPLARGLDLPHVIRYALFLGVPKIVISLKFETNLSHLLWALSSIRSYIVKKLPQHMQKVDNWISQLRRYQYLTEEFVEERPDLKERLDQLRSQIGEFLSSEELVRIMSESEEITLRKTEEGYQLVVSDATGYLQASGRTSRMYAGGVTKGFSLIFVDDKKAFHHLVKKVRWFSDDINFLPVEGLDVEKIMEEVDADRSNVRAFMKGDVSVSSSDLLKPVLIVVESPNKARTIANFFGKAVRRRVGQHDLLETSVEDRYLMITASLGHVLDLVKEGGFHGVLMEKGVTPMYEVIEGKEYVVESLRRMASESMEVLIATDPDTEGEKIGWDLMQLLKPYNHSIRRMEFHEVTKKAILRALKEPRDINENLVKAQIVRRVSDRWVGFEFSQILQQAFGKSWLSAGRVQTPVLGWIIEREKEYRQKIYKVQVLIRDEKGRLKLELDFEDRKTAEAFFKELSYIEVTVKDQKEELRNPPPPFRTDTLLKEASDRYRFSLPKTMALAQTLFELGFITYHRTDSVRVSDYGMSIAREYIEEELGKEYVHTRQWGEGGAHECIRPTRPLEPEELRSMVLSGQVEGLTKEHILLYELIFRRFMASQTRAVKVKVKDVVIKALDRSVELSLVTDVLQDGWNKFLDLELNPDIPPRLDVRELKQMKKQPKAYLYTHGELVQEMKRRGIGRPSTYATIVEKLLERGYVIEKRGFLIPTKLGKKVYEYLRKREEIKAFLSEDFTRRLEEVMDRVEEGKADYEEVLKGLYRDIIKVEAIMEVTR